MKKMLLSAVASVALASTTYAANAEKNVDFGMADTFIYPCEGLILVMDSKGDVIDHLIYLSNESEVDCIGSIKNKVEEFKTNYPEAKISYDLQYNA